MMVMAMMMMLGDSIGIGISISISISSDINDPVLVTTSLPSSAAETKAMTQAPGPP